MRDDKCGVYQIRCKSDGKVYIGSSKRIYRRWTDHRRQLKDGTHHTAHLQHAWVKYGADDFEFSVIEECEQLELEQREQYWIDQLLPEFNIIREVFPRWVATPEMQAKAAETRRALAALITHCPQGHLYDEANIYRGKSGNRQCRICNREWVKEVYASETPEQREARRQRMADGYKRESQEQRDKRKVYIDTHKAEKAEYDRQRRERLKAEMTPEQAEINRVRRAATKAKFREKNRAYNREWIKTHPENNRAAQQRYQARLKARAT
jgi:group I intron endonuclease